MHGAQQLDAAELDSHLAIARSVAQEAASYLATSRGQVGAIETKAAARDLVTAWDRDTEQLIRERFAAATPTIPFLGEESGGLQDADGLCWVVDPLDGTVNFTHGLPIYGVSIALEYRGQPVIGVVRAPALGWEFYARVGGGAFHGGQPISVSTTSELANAMLATGFPPDRDTRADNNLAEWVHFQKRASACRRLGAASLDLCMVACGWLDGYWETRLHAWDLSAGALLVREAGGTVTGIDGGQFRSREGHAIASNGRIHQAILDELTWVQNASPTPR